MTLRELRERWESHRKAYETHDALVSGAKVCADIVRDLEEVAAQEDEELLTLSEASVRCGLSVEHLGRLLREGRLPNAGRSRRPRIRAADLTPEKRRAAACSSRTYDVSTDARGLLSRRGGR